MARIKKTDEAFYSGVLVALQCAAISHGDTVIAEEIVNSVDWETLKQVALKNGGIDQMTVDKLIADTGLE